MTNAAYTEALGAALHRPTVFAVAKFGPRLLLGKQMAEVIVFFSLRARPAVPERVGFGFRRRDVALARQAALA